ncbi:MAG: hypothetical protein A2144_01055 [Chloroflexi bacterium RBG_16_50_9]|nr:MAG: hypothetical protein A2144_01055 [Chloroflexi bacterium RBG_16_50_9]
MTESQLPNISNEEVARRQLFTQRLGQEISCSIQHSSLQSIVALVLWHGSLPRGKGGSKYDVDFAVFLRTTTPSALLDTATRFTEEVMDNTKDLTWRHDLHYDGMTMFEAHTHWDTMDATLPHIGVHFYRKIALRELLAEQDWRTEQASDSTFFRVLESYRRYCFFYRHWVYEGFPLYDPDLIYNRLKSLGYSPPIWLVTELRDVVLCVLRGYRCSPHGMCTVCDSKHIAWDFVATLAYAIEGMPIGRQVRYESDMQDFRNELAKSLLSTVIKKNLETASALSESLAKLTF